MKRCWCAAGLGVGMSVEPKFTMLSFHVFAAAAVLAPAGRSRCAIWGHSRCGASRCSADPSADEPIDEARRAFLAQQRPTGGREAFVGTSWSLLLKMTGGGGTMFSVELLDDLRCRFSDNEELGASGTLPERRSRTTEPVAPT